MNDARAYTRDFLRTYAATILDVTNQTGATAVRVFGSFATGKAARYHEL